MDDIIGLLGNQISSRLWILIKNGTDIVAAGLALQMKGLDGFVN